MGGHKILRRSFDEEENNFVDRESDFYLRSWNTGSDKYVNNELETLSGDRPGIRPEMHCDCSAPGKLSNSFVTVLVTVHYLTLLCTKYCARVTTKVDRPKWRPAYMPSSTTSTTTITTEPTSTASWSETTYIESFLNSDTVWHAVTSSTKPKTTTASNRYKPYDTTNSTIIIPSTEHENTITELKQSWTSRIQTTHSNIEDFPNSKGKLNIKEPIETVTKSSSQFEDDSKWRPIYVSYPGSFKINNSKPAKTTSRKDDISFNILSKAATIQKTISIGDALSNKVTRSTTQQPSKNDQKEANATAITQTAVGTTKTAVSSFATDTPKTQLPILTTKSPLKPESTTTTTATTTTTTSTTTTTATEAYK